jgi:hypothetical protein
MNPAPIESRFDTYSAYRQAVADVVALARRELVMFDLDLGQTGLESLEMAEALREFLSAHRENRMRIVVHRPDEVERSCPRMMSIQRLHGHCLSFRQSPDDLRHLADCFLLADGRHAAIRFHADHARGKLLIEQPEEVSAWRRRFEELWELSVPTISSTTLGL